MSEEARIAAVDQAVLLQQALETWTDEAKEKAFHELEGRASKERRVWYCERGRTCDGNPHDGYNYQHARSDQWPPPGRPGISWRTWLLMGGRGSGKTRSGAEYVRKMSERFPRIALIGATNTAIRDTMVEGESGLKNVFKAAGQEVDYKPALRRVIFPSGAIATLFTAEEPDRLRGPQHHAYWMDEPAHYPDIDEMWRQLQFGLRLPTEGAGPHGVCTTTPLPNKWIKKRVEEYNEGKPVVDKKTGLLIPPRTRISKVSTRANLANLDPLAVAELLEEFDGTRLGRQELDGEVLEDVEGALWAQSMIRRCPPPDRYDRLLVSIDPAGTTNIRSDETGIVVVGKVGKTYYVIADHSGKYSPNGWAAKAAQLHRAYSADAIVAEKNFGGDMVKTTIQSMLDKTGEAARIIVTHAAQSKKVRAEPIVGLYEQERVFHVGDVAQLEEEQLTWVPATGPSPNRIDAMVWGITELHGGFGKAVMASARTKPDGGGPGSRIIRPRSVAGASRPGLRRIGR